MTFLPLLWGVTEQLLYLGAGVDGLVGTVRDLVYVGNGGYLLDQGTIPLLRLLEGLLGPPALRNVYLDPEPVQGLPYCAPHQCRLVPQPYHGPVPGELPILHGKGFPGLVGAPILGEHPLLVFRMEDLRPEVRSRGAFLGSVGKHLLNLRAHVDRGACAVFDLLDVDHRRNSLYKGPIPLLGLPQALLGFLTLANISGGDDHATDCRVVEQVGAHALHPTPGTINVSEAVLCLVSRPLSLREGRLRLFKDMRQIVRVYIVEQVRADHRLCVVAEYPLPG